MNKKIEKLKGSVAFTIVSNNYLSQAITLAESFIKNHKHIDFYIFLTEIKNEIQENIKNLNIQIIPIGKIYIPGYSRFIYRYSIMELNTAVKPYAFNYLFRYLKYSNAIYFDPDILIYRNLDDIYKEFNKSSILLTPHILRPYDDQKQPNETTILQSGSYNLGFIGLKNSLDVEDFIEWWMSKLFGLCYVDIPNGIFVDQKWIDLIPSMYPSHKILYDPGYNVAYWNLHERKLTAKNGDFFSNDLRLGFFHFSGFSPLNKSALSKHQNRHNADDSEALKVILSQYSDLLIKNGYINNSQKNYSFCTLTNGLKIDINLTSRVMKWAYENNYHTPDPIKEPNEFCEFLISKDVIPEYPKVGALYYFILQQRNDLQKAFPGALIDSDDPLFQEWLHTSGINEYDIVDLLIYQNDKPKKINYLQEYLTFKEANTSTQSEKTNYKLICEEFIHWMKSGVEKREAITKNKIDDILNAIHGVSKIIDLYFLRGDLQNEFRSLAPGFELDRFINWLNKNRYQLRINSNEILLFKIYVESNSNNIEAMQFLYLHFGKRRLISETLQNLNSIRYLKQVQLNDKILLDAIDCNDYLLPISREEALKFDTSITSIEIDAPVSDLAKYKICEKITNIYSNFNASKPFINIAGYFNAATGMGESANSMQRILFETKVPNEAITLPSSTISPQSNIEFSIFKYGWPNPLASHSITICNADMVESSLNFLPNTFWTPKNIGYWVWETEILPYKFKKNADSFNQIWSPSAYSANSIAKTIGRKVEVLPHALDLSNIDKAKKTRIINLPKGATTYGFLIDPNSNLERKNLLGLITTFKESFRKDDNAYLIIKVNSPPIFNYQYEKIKSLSEHSNIIFIEKTLSKLETLSLIKSLDIYVSLHRSEGFGLTCAEAMALGVPTVASNYSGNLEFMNSHNSILIDTKVIETTRAHGPYPIGSLWGEPNYEHAIRELRQLLDTDFRLHLGSQGKKSVRKTLSPKLIALKLDEILSNKESTNYEQ